MEALAIVTLDVNRPLYLNDPYMLTNFMVFVGENLYLHVLNLSSQRQVDRDFERHLCHGDTAPTTRSPHFQRRDADS